MNNQNPIFFEYFENKQDIEDSFDIELLEDIKILFSYYSHGNYEGSAFVLFEQNGILYEVNGFHCSCHGLEGQWEPEATTKESILHRIEKERQLERYAEEIKAVLKEVET
jgi:hypothetical protein